MFGETILICSWPKGESNIGLLGSGKGPKSDGASVGEGTISEVELIM